MAYHCCIHLKQAKLQQSNNPSPNNIAELNLITVRYNSEIHTFDTLDQAMAWAKELGEFVTIEFDGMEVVGKFGADGIEGGKLSNGTAYTWKKRRRT